jgi:short-subunit dehydrogenase
MMYSNLVLAAPRRLYRLSEPQSFHSSTTIKRGKIGTLMDWSNQVVLITGASSGIGRGLALELARRGARVGLLARRRELLEEIALEISQAGGRALVLSADVTRADEVRAAVGELRRQFGQIDMLFANAGISINTFVPNLCEKTIADLINVNVIGVVNSVSAVLSEMVAQGSGHLVVNSSLAAYRGLPKSAAYCASKAAISSFFEALRIDLKGTGVDVTIIHPGFVKTQMIRSIARTPYVMEVDEAVRKIVRAIEKRKKGYAFPWQLAMVARACKLLPIPMYDWFAVRNSFRS